MTTAPHGTWTSPLTPQVVVAGARSVRELQVDGETLSWLELRPDEEGRTAIVRRGADGTVADVTPTGSNVRTRVHEYGGGSYLVTGGVTWYVDFADQRVHRLDPGSAEPRPITPDPGQPAAVRYADFAPTPDGSHLLCIRETHHGPAATDVVNEVVAIPADGAGEAVVLATGRDFYASPSISPDGRLLTYVSWDHPNMPWDATEVVLADLDGLVASNPRPVAGGTRDSAPSRAPSEAAGRRDGTPGAGGTPAGTTVGATAAGADSGSRAPERESAILPRFSPASELHLVSDRSGWWNLHRLETDGTLTNLLPIEADLGQPGWQLGQSIYGFLDDGRIACVATDGAVERPSILDPAGGTLARLSDHTMCRDLTVSGDTVWFAAGSPTAFPAILRARFGGPPASEQDVEVVHRTRELPVDVAWLPRPEAISFPTGDGETAHAFLYPPTNPDVSAPHGALPPLIVTSHGGPTSSNPPMLSLGTAYWTSRGFAVVDVNYRGSTGFGRAYRDALRDRWGIADVQDCEAAAAFLADRGDVDGDRLLIRGESASGYTTLCALAFTATFAAGASHYGVADPALLAEETHKFESRYLDGLLGPYPEARATFEARSPLHHADGITCPVILFQGLEDRVVPPSQSEAMVAALARNGIPHAYLAFPGEQHGFRNAMNIVTCLEAELSFYAQVLGIPHPEGIPQVELVTP
jgi:dipeptidyl aminopeptidase/acylaminoacyl peptidase